MDISKYKKYIRDVSLTDTELTDLIKDVVNDIARDTKIFRYQFGFNITPCQDVYNIRDLCNMATSLDERVDTVTYHQDISKEKTINSINFITEETDDKSDISCSDGNDDNDITITKTLSATEFTYLNYLDLVYVEPDEVDTSMIHNSQLIHNIKGRSVMYEFFENITFDLVKSKDLYLKNLYGSDYNLQIISDTIIIPNLDNITDEEEEKLKSTIIAGIKYFISDMYMNATNEQISNVLYQRYYANKKQLLYNYPQLTSEYVWNKNASWNK